MSEPVIFRMGIPVLDHSGKQVGTLEQLVFHETQKKIVEMVVRELSGLRRLPMDLVSEISPSSIHLAKTMTAEGLSSWPIFHPEDYEEVPSWFFPPGAHIEIGALVTLKPCDIREMGEEHAMSRRDFMAKSTVVVASMIGVSLVVPIGGYILTATQTKVTDHWVDLGITLDSLPMDTPIAHLFFGTSVSGWMKVAVSRTVWLIHHSNPNAPDSKSEDQIRGMDSPLEAKNSDPRLTVLSPVCPHLGCAPQWTPAQKEFICPCHHSIYQLNGNRVSGPAPRPMDSLPVRVSKDGSISIVYEQFVVGIPQKVRLS